MAPRSRTVSAHAQGVGPRRPFAPAATSGVQMFKTSSRLGVGAALAALSMNAAWPADGDVQAQLNALKAAIPKFAIPMREVSDRFQNMYFAAKGGNWALAAYMSKYMNGAMNPARLTKPEEYKEWQSFY